MNMHSKLHVIIKARKGERIIMNMHSKLHVIIKARKGEGNLP